MRLADYLAHENITQAEFAARARVSQSLVSHWLKGAKEPSMPMARHIGRVTNGMVTPNDWAESEEAAA